MLQAAIIVVANSSVFHCFRDLELTKKYIYIYHVSAQLSSAHRCQLHWNISDFIFFYKITSLLGRLKKLFFVVSKGLQVLKLFL